MASKIECLTAELFVQTGRKGSKDPTMKAGGTREDQHRNESVARRSTKIVQGDPHAVAGIDHRWRLPGPARQGQSGPGDTGSGLPVTSDARRRARLTAWSPKRS